MLLAYQPGRTVFHRLDPLTKFVWLLLLSVWLFSLRDVANVLLISGAVLLLAVFAAGIDLRRYIKFSLLLFSGGGFLVVYQAIFQPGAGIDVGAVHFSINGALLGVAISLRNFGLVAGSLAFSTTTSPKDFELMLIKVGLPYRFAKVLYMSLRLLPVFEKDFQNLQDAQKLRGVKGIRALRTSLIALAATELRQVDNIALALETRGFGLHETRTELTEVKISTLGMIMVIATLVAMIAHLLYVYVY
ncbi:MAG TPA: energy-coupling factor transporter transmembrane component T [Candidatus Saccharimonadales bacterium]|nr:energy-coupling factor transporter transmembrane component T [Candidatus Saccharimonadales bacterium]